jgi:uncharacterized iron-regulated membrane protein
MPRTVLFWLHLVAGVLAGAIILLMSVTGVLLTYEKQMTLAADMRQIQPISATATNRLSADSLIQLATALRNGTAPSALTIRADSAAPVQLAFGREGVIYLDPTTGASLGEGNAAVRAFFASMTEWHRWLAGKDENRKLGKQITGIANLAFLVLVLTGMVLWLPRTFTWIRFKSVLWFRGGLSGKARDFNWHNVLGIWSAIPLVIIVASATVIGYPWASDLVYKAVGEAPPPRNAGGQQGGSGAPGAAQPAVAGGRGETPVGDQIGGRRGNSAELGQMPTERVAPAVTYAAALAMALPLMPEWKAATLQLPKPDAKTIAVTLDRGTGGQPHLRATVQIAKTSGAVDKFQPFDSLTTGRQVRNVLRFAHTGEVLGLLGQTLAGLVSLASVVLVVTGITLSIRRASAALDRRNRPTRSDTVGVAAD